MTCPPSTGDVPRDREAAAEYLLGRVNYERMADVTYSVSRFKLERMHELLDRLGSPHSGLPVVHIAGTKGKGSTATMIATILTDAGCRTGLFTSPHLEQVEERFAVDGAICSGDELVELVATVKPAVEAMDREARQRPDWADFSPTYFEILTAMAFVHFARQAADVAVLEVGMGGRLDSTNVCRPLVSVLTSISLDHTAQLGDTVEQIAAEKAGIVKPGVPVVSGVVEPGPRQVIRDTADRLGCRLVEAGIDFQVIESASKPADAHHTTAFDYRETDGEPLRGLWLAMPGRHQMANAGVALAAIGQLRQAGWNIPDAAVRSGLARAFCRGRVEILDRRPTVVLDVAHNRASVAALVDVLNRQFPDRRKWGVFAAGKDKDLRGMIDVLSHTFDQMVFTRYLENPRAASPEQLADLARELTGRTFATRPTPAESWAWAVEQASPEDLICIAGSFFLIHEIRHAFPFFRSSKATSDG